MVTQTDTEQLREKLALVESNAGSIAGGSAVVYESPQSPFTDLYFYRIKITKTGYLVAKQKGSLPPRDEQGSESSVEGVLKLILEDASNLEDLAEQDAVRDATRKAGEIAGRLM